ncbi:MAG: hypothetical protein ACREDS_09310 [Limisphaerales bacterium]
MIDKVPAKGVLKAVELECQMLQNDLARKRTLPLEEVRSILAFSDFLKNASGNVRPAACALPMQHLGFYRKTIERLIEAGELPAETKEQFDKTFSSGLVKSLNA